jgi:tRNA(Arg) A34 adenosine deaminase TadA
MLPAVRTSGRQTYRNWNTTVKGEVQALLETLAAHVKDNLTITAWVGPAPAVVSSRIRDAAGLQVAVGQYDSGTGAHAEVAAISALGAAAWVNAHTIATSLEPCHRCAVILRAFELVYGWTVEAPQRAFASNYPGAYSLPDAVYAVVVTRMGTVPAAELTHFSREIKSMICGFGVAH